jgi:crotonobetainyl-CoA:carnitine CoA-transferase CaiB-like acyl-CoA transferase
MSERTNASRPLEGTRVVELARYQAGPRCGLTLADLGAEVIKIEKPGGEVTRRAVQPTVGGESLYFAAYNRGKKSLCLDIRSESGKAVLRDLVSASDIVLENFRPGTMDRMGFGYEVLRRLNKGVILLSISGFGQDSSYGDRPAFDGVAQAMSGLMALTGRYLDRPVGTAFSSSIGSPG